MKKKKAKKTKKPRLKKKVRAKKKTQLNNARTSCRHSSAWIVDSVVTVENPAGRQIRLDWDDINAIAIWLSDLAGVNPDDVFPDFLVMYKLGILDLEKNQDGWLVTALDSSPEAWKRLDEILLPVKGDQKCRRWNRGKDEN